MFCNNNSLYTSPSVSCHTVSIYSSLPYMGIDGVAIFVSPCMGTYLMRVRGCGCYKGVYSKEDVH